MQKALSWCYYNNIIFLVSSDDPQPQSIMKRSSQQQQQQQSQAQQSGAASQQLMHNHPVHHHQMAPPTHSHQPPSSSSSGLHNHAMVGVGNAEMYINIRRLHRSARDLKQEVKVLRRLTQLQSMAMKDLVQDTYIKLREACISYSTSQSVVQNNDPELGRLAQNEDTFTKELNELVQAIGKTID